MGSDWGALDWIGYGCVAIAALMPALGLAVAAEPSFRQRTVRIFENRWWKIVPAVALTISAVILFANQMGWTNQPNVSSGATNNIELVRQKLDPPTSMGGYGFGKDRWLSVSFNSTELLLPWSEKYDLIAIGQVNFANVDRMTNKGISKSVRYTIDGYALNVVVQIAQGQIDLIRPGEGGR